MKYPVKKAFRDKYTKVVYYPGDIYETKDITRGEYLQKAGFFGNKIAELRPAVEGTGTDLLTSPVSLGGGWYQLPDGRKVRKAELGGE